MSEALTVLGTVLLVAVAGAALYGAWFYLAMRWILRDRANPHYKAR